MCRLILVVLAAVSAHFTVAFTSSSPVTHRSERIRYAVSSKALDEDEDDRSRRSMVAGTVVAGVILSQFSLCMAAIPSPAEAKPDCVTDCVKNCKQVVPNDTSNYCRDSCLDYCAQPDRRDGLSGSVSSEGGEVGILGGTFGQGTVVKGEDKPPVINLPGLNFNSKEGKQLLGL